MGKVIVKIKLTNLNDTFLKTAGARKAKPREVVVDALVDTGATRLYLKPSVIKKLGLERTDMRADLQRITLPNQLKPLYLERLQNQRVNGRCWCGRPAVHGDDYCYTHQ